MHGVNYSTNIIQELVKWAAVGNYFVKPGLKLAL
jgi:hypothetical protein